jgi:hypothetical protein
MAFVTKSTFVTDLQALIQEAEAIIGDQTAWTDPIRRPKNTSECALVYQGIDSSWCGR